MPDTGDGAPDVKGFGQCRDAPENRNDFEDDDGCPDVKAVVTREEIKVDMVFFDTGKATLQDVSYPVLDAVVRVLGEHPEITFVEVQGHTDERNSDAYNLNLSQRRAATVLEYLVSKGVAPSRLRAKGYGERSPLVDGHDEAAWSQNRRVVFKIERRSE